MRGSRTGEIRELYNIHPIRCNTRAGRKGLILGMFQDAISPNPARVKCILNRSSWSIVFLLLYREPFLKAKRP